MKYASHEIYFIKKQMLKTAEGNDVHTVNQLITDIHYFLG